jgi:hypothetical protein
LEVQSCVVRVSTPQKRPIEVVDEWLVVVAFGLKVLIEGKWNTTVELKECSEFAVHDGP